LRLTDPQVSRRHLAIEPSGARLRLTDVGSTNGTRVDGLQVMDAYLGGGETVVVGDTTLRVVRTTKSRPIEVLATGVFGRLVGESDAMRRLYPLCQRLAAS